MVRNRFSRWVGAAVFTGAWFTLSAVGEEGREPFGINPLTGWFDAPAHRHLGLAGTPQIHSFRLEPAFTHRDLFFDFGYRQGPGGYENELEVELEWAFTRRIGLVIEVPYVFDSPDGGLDVDGFGDLAFSPRFLIAEFERFLMSFNLEVETPTGDPGRGLGDDEWKLAPTFSTWLALGESSSFNTQFGVERALESDSSEFIFRASLVHTLLGLEEGHHDEHDEHGHLEPGHLSLILELDGTVGMTGDEEGDVAMEGIVGFYYGLGESTDVRIGWQFPLSSPREIDGGVSIGLVKHF